MPEGNQSPANLEETLHHLEEPSLCPLDLLPPRTLVEKLIELEIQGVPEVPYKVSQQFAALLSSLRHTDTSGLRVVVLGGGTGLSNVIGGDSRQQNWPSDPFHGLKAIFPNTRAIVCVTDDGGSTGELLKDLPLIALGDLRHVMLSSVQEDRLARLYGYGRAEALATMRVLHAFFNHRFTQRPVSIEDITLLNGFDLDILPESMRERLYQLLALLFTDPALAMLLDRPHCLGNLLIAASIHLHRGRNGKPSATTFGGTDRAVVEGIRTLSSTIGASPDAVFPCTTTPARLKIRYANGVMVTGENKSGLASRNFPVDRVFVEFVREPHVPVEVLAAIREADIIIFAPGSLFTSIIPILQTPGVAAAVRENRHAFKTLIANLWVQRGETDLSREDPKRRFHISDLLLAYHRNIPGGVHGLFRQVMVIGLRDVQGSILQSYAVEGKMPIYLDRSRVFEMGFLPVEGRIFSKRRLAERRVVQHDAENLARAVRTAWAVRGRLQADAPENLPSCFFMAQPVVHPSDELPNERYSRIRERLTNIDVEADLRGKLVEILWYHQDIPLDHLDFMEGVSIVPTSQWSRDQAWDRILSFYDPEKRVITIRQDITGDEERLEVAFLIALGQSLLGNYAATKAMRPVVVEQEHLGKIFELCLRPEAERSCFFSTMDLHYFLELARMQRSSKDQLRYTRLVNSSEGFTPPGLLLGMTYAWYLDNRFAAHIEYKMAIRRIAVSDLIHEQVRMRSHRQSIIDFFRCVVFRQDHPAFTEGKRCSR